MKRLMKLLFIIILAILLSGTIAYALVTELSYGETSRGVKVQISFGGSGSIRR